MWATYFSRSGRPLLCSHRFILYFCGDNWNIFRFVSELYIRYLWQTYVQGCSRRENILSPLFIPPISFYLFSIYGERGEQSSVSVMREQTSHTYTKWSYMYWTITRLIKRGDTERDENQDITFQQSIMMKYSSRTKSVNV